MNQSDIQIKVEIPQNFVHIKLSHNNTFLIIDPRQDHEPDLKKIDNIMMDIKKKIKRT